MRGVYRNPAHQQAVGVDAVWRTGDQGAVVFPLLNLQSLHILGLYDQDLIHLVGRDLVEDVDMEHIPLHQLIQVGKQGGRGQAPVPGEHPVDAVAANGEGTALQRAHARLQHAL